VFEGGEKIKNWKEEAGRTCNSVEIVGPTKETSLNEGTCDILEPRPGWDK